MTISAYSVLQPYIVPVMQAVCVCIDMHHISVCNNAVWSASELTMKLGKSIALSSFCIARTYGLLGADVTPYAAQIFERTVYILKNYGRADTTVTENAAICIGRLGLFCPTVPAAHLTDFVVPWYACSIWPFAIAGICANLF